jgi:RNA polymerase sigma factor (sigma-70 family)
MAHPLITSLLRHLRGLTQAADHSLTDFELLGRFVQQRDQTAFATLVQRHGPMVLGVCRRLLADPHAADDAFQASFLVLVRRARAIPWRESVGSWLYQVACRTALKARTAAARRQFHEKETAAMRPLHTFLPTSVPDWHDVLDAELQALPAKYRMPLVLCGLEGLSRAEAARQLGWKEGTLSGRLARARELLRTRLARRGVALTVAALAELLEPAATSAAVAPHLADSTVQSAALLAAGEVAVGVAVPILTLAQAVHQELFLARLRLVLPAVLLVGLLGAGTASIVYQLMSRQTPEAAVTGDFLPVRDPEPVGPPPPGVDRLGDPLPQRALHRFGTLRLHHENTVTWAAFGADGKTLRSAGEDQTIRQWDIATGRELGRVQLQTCGAEVPQNLRLSPDGKTLVTWATNSDTDLGVSLWDAATGEQRRRLEGHEKRVLFACFSADSATLATGAWDGTVRLWDVASGKQTRVIPDPTGAMSKATLCAAFAPGNDLLAVVYLDRQVRLWDVRTGKHVRQMAGPAWGNNQIAFSADGSLLGIAGSPAVCVWKVATGEVVRQVELDHSPTPNIGLWPRWLAFSPDGKYFATMVEQTGVVHLVEVATGTVVRQFLGTQSVPVGREPVVFSPDGKMLAVLGGASISLWETATGRPLHGQQSHQGQVGSVALTPDGRTLVTADLNSVRLWDARTGQQQRSVTVEPHWEHCAVAASSDGRLLAHAGEGPIRLWSLDTGKELQQFQQHRQQRDYNASALAFSGDSRMLASTTARGGPTADVWLWDVATGKELHRFEGPRGSTMDVALAFAADNKTIAQAVMGLRLLDVPGRQLRLEVSQEGKNAADPFGAGAVFAVAIAPDSKTFAAFCCWGGPNDPPCGLFVFDMATGKVVRRIAACDKWGGALTYTPDGKILASGHFDGTITLWDVKTDRKRGHFTGHAGAISALSFAADGRTLASGSTDGTALIWDLR